MLYPSDNILEQFIAISAPLFEQKKTLEQQNQKLTEARDLLLPRLMSGELEV